MTVLLSARRNASDACLVLLSSFQSCQGALQERLVYS